MTYYTTKCPHCGEYIKIHSKQKTSLGCPFKVCSHCGQTYVDPNCYEPAFKPYRKSSKFKYGLLAFIASLFITVFPLTLLAYFSKFSISTVGIICGVLFLIIFFILLHSGLSNYEKTEASILTEWKESEARLRKPEYVKSLVKAGFKVPEIYTYGIEFEQEDPYKTDPQKFVCSNCGNYSSGWYQTCPKCGASGKIEKTTDYLKKEAKIQQEKEKAEYLEKERTRKKFVCKQCGNYSVGWYQTCPQCGAVGKMEKAEEKPVPSQLSKPIENNHPETPRKEKRFRCRNCWKVSTGWYQTCPTCGAVGKMEEVYVVIKNEESAPQSTPKERVINSVPSPQANDNIEKEVAAVAPKTDKSLSQQLMELKSLADAGLITQEEYAAKKKQILGL